MSVTSTTKTISYGRSRRARRNYVTGSNFSEMYYDFGINTHAELDSVGHPWPPTGGYGGDVGGNFKSQKEEFWSDAPYIESMAVVGEYNESFKGRVLPRSPVWTDFNRDRGSSIARLGEYGTTAIARSLPTNPVADTSVFLGETLREGIPRLVGIDSLRKGLSSRTAAGEYLNYEFGIKPLINDLQKFAKAVSDSHKIITQLERDSGRNVRRRYRFPVEEETRTSDTSWSYPEGVAHFGAGSAGLFFDVSKAKYNSTISVHRETWFSGCFTYHLELGSSNRDKLGRLAQEADKLLGISLSPEVVWNLTPWTWAADWVSNAGDVVHNVSRFAKDGLVMRYGYIMEKTLSNRTDIVSGIKYRNFNTGAMTESLPTLRSDLSISTKQRQSASPYGFGLSYDGFTDRQKAILAALAISRR